VTDAIAALKFLDGTRRDAPWHACNVSSKKSGAGIWSIRIYDDCFVVIAYLIAPGLEIIAAFNRLHEPHHSGDGTKRLAISLAGSTRQHAA